MNDLILENTIGINDEEAAQSDALIFQKYTIVAANIFGDVRGQDVFDRTESALGVRGIDPGSVTVNTVSRDGQYFGAGFFDFFVLRRESLQFGRANEGEI
jgi:hypothetical protein